MVLIFFILSFFYSTTIYAQDFPICSPFLIHKKVSLPYKWENSPALNNSSTKKEIEFLLKKISLIKNYAHFSQEYLARRNKQFKNTLDLKIELNLLRCIYFYLNQDTDNDGILDWSALANGQLMQVLIPNDDDIDGDGTFNIFDPDPFDPQIKGENYPSVVPEHLISTRLEAKAIQKKLYEKYEIIAIDYSDNHSEFVLHNLLLLLDGAFQISSIKNLKNFRYIYAFSGHDLKRNIAAFHLEAKAISIGGENIYHVHSKQVDQISLLATLAHEIGHAFLFQNIAAKELIEIAKKFGGWTIPTSPLNIDLFSQLFLTPYPEKEKFIKSNSSQEYHRLPVMKKNNFNSSYSSTNIHEWFADAFAASILQKLGKSKLLGENWQKKLIQIPKNKRGFWTNYNNISNSFSSWLEKKMNHIDSIEQKLSY